MNSKWFLRGRQHKTRDRKKKTKTGKDRCLLVSTSFTSLCSFSWAALILRQGAWAGRHLSALKSSHSLLTTHNNTPHTDTHTYTGRESCGKRRLTTHDRVLIMSWQCLASIHECHSSVAEAAGLQSRSAKEEMQILSNLGQNIFSRKLNQIDVMYLPLHRPHRLSHEAAVRIALTAALLEA